MFKTKKAFTLIELLVVIAIIGILASVSIIALSNARAKSRDAKRAGDMKQVQTALELFFNDKGRYPTEQEWSANQIFSTSTSGTSTYMQIVPAAPIPADGNCTSEQNNFSYIQTDGGSSYTLSFCLGSNTGTITGGLKAMTPAGIMSITPSCVSSVWTPAEADMCDGESFVQTSNCSVTRSATGSGSDTSWTPATATVCSGESFSQDGNCGGSRSSTGTLTCSEGQSL